MALETGSYVADLVITNPTATDAKSAGDDHLRLIKTALRNSFAGFNGAIIVSGTNGGAANAYTLTPTTALGAYGTNMLAVFTPAADNTGAATLNISGLGAKDIKTVAGAALTSGDLVAGNIYFAAYNGTNFRLVAVTKNYVDQLAFSSALPAQTGNSGKRLATDGTNASWVDSVPIATAGGTVDAITATFVPAIQLTDGVICAVICAGANTSTTPTFNANGLGAKTITMSGGGALKMGSIGAAGYVALLEYNLANTRWELMNPVSKAEIVSSARTSNTILGAADNGKLIDITSGTFSQTFTAAATLGSGWHCYIRNGGTGDITLDPNSTEQIDGLTSYIMYPGEVRLIQCDGSAFRSVVLQPFYKVFTSTDTFVKPPGYLRFAGLAWSGGASGQRTNNAGTISTGGSGGGCFPFSLLASEVGTTETVTIGAGGASVTDVGGALGNPGGNTSIGSLFTVYAGANARTGGAIGVSSAFTSADAAPYGFEASAPATSAIRNSIYGGTSSSVTISVAGGSSIYGGAVGGSLTAAAAVLDPGTSKFGGDGGAASSASNGSDGTAPGGGGGATQTGTQSGAGARGEVRIWGVA